MSAQASSERQLKSAPRCAAHKLGLALGPAMDGEPAFVTAIEPESNVVTLGRRADLRAESLTLDELHWLADPVEADAVSVQVRAHGDPVPARVVGDRTVRVDLGEPLYGVAPGQAAVLYDGDRVLGGGTIEKTS